MGSYAIADRIYRQDPAVMLYAPLRTLTYIDSGDRTRFAVDQPSTVLASFADPAIAELGARLDRQLADPARRAWRRGEPGSWRRRAPPAAAAVNSKQRQAVSGQFSAYFGAFQDLRRCWRRRVEAA